MYLQDKPSTRPSEVPSGETEEATSIHLTKVYKSLSHGTEDTSAFDQVLSINWQMNTMLLTQVPCPVTSTFYPGPKLLALPDRTFAEYLFLCLIDAHGKTSLCGSHQVPLDYGQAKLLQTFCEEDSYDYPMISDLPKHVFRSSKFYFCLVHPTTYCCRHYFLCSKIFFLHTPSFRLTLQLSDHYIFKY